MDFGRTTVYYVKDGVGEIHFFDSYKAALFFSEQTLDMWNYGRFSDRKLDDPPDTAESRVNSGTLTLG